MCPIYAVLAAPLVRPLRIPLVLWFTHWRASRLLQAAERVSTAVVSVDRRSFPLDSNKVRAIGHGIDLTEFSCTSHERDGGELRLLALGRYSPAKGLDVVLRALASVGSDVRLDVHGPALSAEERAHRASSSAWSAGSPLDGRVELRGRRPSVRGAVAARRSRRAREQHARRCSRQGRLRSCGSMRSRAGLEPGIRLAARLRSAVRPRGSRRPRGSDSRAGGALSSRAGDALGRRLRERVEEGHSVDSWARGVLEAAGIS